MVYLMQPANIFVAWTRLPYKYDLSKDAGKRPFSAVATTKTTISGDNLSHKNNSDIGGDSLYNTSTV